jgi:hypothetical protein
MLLTQLAVSNAARAQPGFSLQWNAPGVCPQRAEVVSRVREVAAVSNYEHVGLTAVGTILQVAQRYVLVLRISEDNRVSLTRQIAARDCADLAGAAAVVLALALKEASTSTADSGAAAKQAPLAPESSSAEAEARENPHSADDPAGESEASRERDKTTAPAPAPEDTAPTPPTDAAREATVLAPESVSSQSDSNFWLSLPQLATAVGGLPGLGIQFGAGFVARYQTWGLCLAGRYELPRSIQAAAVPNVGARVARYFADGTLFHAWRMGDLEWAPGLVGGVMVMDAWGTGLDITPSHARAALGYVGANASLRWYAAKWVVISGGLAAHAFSVRPRVVVSPLGEVRKLGLGQIVLSVGSEWNF